MAVERPDSSNEYDDDALIQIIADRFHRLPADAIDDITRRDMTWILALVQRRADPLPPMDSCLCSAANCVCLRLIGRAEVCSECAAGNHKLTSWATPLK